MKFGLAVLGVLLGGWFEGVAGAIAGGALGLFGGLLFDMRNRLGALDRRLSRLEEEGAWAAQEGITPASAERRPIQPEARAPSSVSKEPPPAAVRESEPAAPLGFDRERTTPVPSAEDLSPEPAQPTQVRPRPFDEALAALRALVLSGNTVVRVGILVTLVGVTLLVKWAADHDYLPIELRMAGAALIGIALIVVGFRTRNERPGFAQTLQGGGVATLYLVIFFSFRTYGLLPSGLTFALLAAVAFFSGALAVLQDALPLIVIAEVGGFMAPVLASTGEGNHVALFSYYVVLNLAIFGVAWFKAWRLPNLLGFLFTFGVGTTWGALRYEPEQFWTTEPFLIIFFALYLAIPVLFAIRNPDEKQGWIDGTLVFGTPLATLGLQHALVHDVRFGMAFSTLALALVYIGVGFLLYKRAPKVLSSLAEALVAIGIGFATLAIPYGFDNHNLTGATWALEGAGLYWVGVRQNRWLPRIAGASLQVFGGFALLWQAAFGSGTQDVLPFANTRFLAAFLIAVSSLFVARQAYANRERLLTGEGLVLQWLIAWGVAFWLSIGIQELVRELPDDWLAGGMLVFVGVTAAALELSGRRFDWLPGRYPAALVIPLMGLLLFGWWSDIRAPLFEEGGAVGWPIYVAACLLVLRRFVPDAPEWARFLHPLFLWFATVFLSMLAADAVVELADLRGQWWAAMVVTVGAALTGATLSLSRHDVWPFTTFRDLYQGVGLGVSVSVLLAAALVMSVAFRANTPPLFYLPILNPVDLAQLTVLAVAFSWAQHLDRIVPSPFPELARWKNAILGGAAFIWFTSLLARSVHHYANVPFAPNTLWDSVAFQVAVTVSWALIGLVMTVSASRRGRRVHWILGASLLGVVVVKLFLVDLEQLSTPAKIGTFLVVGMLLLLVGYLSPVPPARSEPGGEANELEEVV